MEITSNPRRFMRTRTTIRIFLLVFPLCARTKSTIKKKEKKKENDKEKTWWRYPGPVFVR